MICFPSFFNRDCQMGSVTRKSVFMERVVTGLKHRQDLARSNISKNKSTSSKHSSGSWTIDTTETSISDMQNTNLPKCEHLLPSAVMSTPHSLKIYKDEEVKHKNISNPNEASSSNSNPEINEEASPKIITRETTTYDGEISFGSSWKEVGSGKGISTIASIIEEDASEFNKNDLVIYECLVYSSHYNEDFRFAMKGLMECEKAGSKELNGSLSMDGGAKQLIENVKDDVVAAHFQESEYLECLAKREIEQSTLHEQVSRLAIFEESEAKKTSEAKHSEKGQAGSEFEKALDYNDSEKMSKEEKNLESLSAASATSASLSPKQGDTKPWRTSGLPSYTFDLKCFERAERRKEFYSKLEEKMYAREVERTNLKMKAKEIQEVEIKMLRKSLSFKANPMPSFYSKPASPKVELMKKPPTRAKSPNLSHRRSPAISSSPNCSPNQLDHPDDKLNRKGVKKESYLQQFKKQLFKKPLQKSIPKLYNKKSGVCLENATPQGPDPWQHHSQKIELQTELASSKRESQSNVEADAIAAEKLEEKSH